MKWNEIKGWFSEDDARSYNELVLLTHSGIMVEVGSYLGRSIASISDTAKLRDIQIIAVDIWEDTEEDFVGMGFTFPTKKQFSKNAPYAIPFQTTSLKGAKSLMDTAGKGFLSAVFLDATHHYEDVKSDIDAWLPLVKKGGWIGGHDFCSGWDGVRRAVKDTFGKDFYTLPNTIWVHNVE